MHNWQYRAFKTDTDGNTINEVVEGEMSATNFPHLAILLSQKGLRVEEATKLNPDNSLASQRLTKMRSRVLPPGFEMTHKIPATSAIRKWLSWFIPPFFKR